MSIKKEAPEYSIFVIYFFIFQAKIFGTTQLVVLQRNKISTDIIYHNSTWFWRHSYIQFTFYNLFIVFRVLVKGNRLHRLSITNKHKIFFAGTTTQNHQQHWINEITKQVIIHHSNKQNNNTDQQQQPTYSFTSQCIVDETQQFIAEGCYQLGRPQKTLFALLLF